MNISPQKRLRMAEAAIEDDKLILPSPPDAIVKILEVLDDDDASPRKIAIELNRDPALTARIIKIAKSASFQQHHNVTDLNQIIPRLGIKLIKTLVTSHMMLQLFAQPNLAHKQLLNQLFRNSLNVARYAYAIARDSRTISAEDALLAGLMVDIGYLPLLQSLGDSSMEANTLDDFLIRFHSRIGAQLLNKWHVPGAIVLAVAEHEDLQRDSAAEADLSDVIIVANLFCREKDQHSDDPKSNASAYDRLGIDRKSDFSELSEYLAIADTLLPGN